MSIQAEHIHKNYGEFQALNDVSLSVAAGELVALLGPSGSGKTTLLRIIAGLETPDSGRVFLNDEDVVRHTAAQRGIGFVFQHYALFRHMTVYENVAFGLRVQSSSIRPSRREIKDRVLELLRLVQLDSLAQMFPSQLSGGQRQRVALARALAVKPRVLLLDEPFSALDAKVRKELRTWLRRVHDELRVTTVLVTHDQEEALEVADKVAILNEGSLEQCGTPQEIYDNPASPFVYHFLGNVNLFHGRMLADIAMASGTSDSSDSMNASVGFVRPHELEIARDRPHNEPALATTVVKIHAAGPVARVELASSSNGDPVVAELSRKQLDGLALAPGEVVFVKPLAIRVFEQPKDDVLAEGAGI